MKIELKRIKIKDLVNGFEDNDELGVVAYNGNLDIRPPYQRSFVYKPEQENAVINSIMNDFPLNIMYWAKTKAGFEMLDGQQRTLSICNYHHGDKAWDNGIDKPLYFHNLPNDLKEKFLNYELTIYICDGSDSEKLKWFETINIAGETLTKQELRNAVYSGHWVSDAKKIFSKVNGAGDNLSKKYVTAAVNRQELLEKAIEWICFKEECSIENYMGKHQNDDDTQEMWVYFQNVINWIKTNFIKYRKEMKNVDWGKLYHNHKDKKMNPKELEKEISNLMKDDEVTKKSGIYEYVLTSNKKYLSLRAFTDSQKTTAYERQNGICKICKKKFEINEMHADHMIPWIRGGKTTDENLQMLCTECNLSKSDK